jgi:hypothetical protein
MQVAALCDDRFGERLAIASRTLRACATAKPLFQRRRPCRRRPVLLEHGVVRERASRRRRTSSRNIAVGRGFQVRTRDGRRRRRRWSGGCAYAPPATHDNASGEDLLQHVLSPFSRPYLAPSFIDDCHSTRSGATKRCVNAVCGITWKIGKSQWLTVSSSAGCRACGCGVEE